MSDPKPIDYAALLKRSLVTIDQLEARLAASERAQSEPIAIVGIGCRFPTDADTPEAFWQQLYDGVDAVTEVPKERWDADRLFDPDPDAVGKSYTRWGAFIKDVDRFDAGFFGISPREAVHMDPQQRLLLEMTWEALEHAGIAPSSLTGSQTAVYVGITTHDYAMELAEKVGTRFGDAYTPSGTAHSVAAGRLSYVLGLHGPNVAIDTACSSSLVALHWAAQSLRHGEADVALAGGVNLTLTADGAVLTSRARMMSFDGRCKTFDASADGYVRGEGGGMLVLKRLADARRDGDRVLGLLRGSALNQDGRSSGLTAPNGLAQQAVIRAALANARLAPGDIDYVEAHGTGTPLGDPIEVKALDEVYGSRPAGAPLRIGSVKTNIGHLEAAAGVAGVVKTLLALDHQCIPPHLHLHEPNPLIPWDTGRIEVPTRPTPWPSHADRPRRAAISSFGFSGTNAHVVLEEAPVVEPPPAPATPWQLLVLSAQSPEALRALAGRYADMLSRPGAPAWADVAATAALGRSHLPERLALVADSGPSAGALLDAVATSEAPVDGTWRGRAAGGSVPEVVFMFTGQGAQYPGMSRHLYDTEPVFRHWVSECDRLLAPHLPRPLLSVVFGDAEDAALLDDTAYTQPALFAVEYALAQLWRSWGIEPTAVMGHSVGEYVAACVAGVFGLEDGLRLIAQRGRLMSTLPRDGSMAAVFCDEARVQAAMAGRGDVVSIAAVNGPGNVVVSGRSDVVDALVAQFSGEGVEAQRLNVSHAFHSPLMAPILDRFEAVAASVSFSAPRMGLISNVTGRLADDDVLTPAYWRRHLREAVRFADSIETLRGDGYRVFLEVGPTAALVGMAQRCRGAGELVFAGSLRKGRDDRVSMLENLARLHVCGHPVQWAAVLGEHATRRRATLPLYPFQRQRYWHTLEAAPGQTALAVSRSGHPLIGGVLGSALPIHQTELGLDRQPWLADHRIFEFTLFPATGFLELAAAAAQDTLGASVSLRDVSIREGLPLQQDVATIVQIIGTPAGGDSLALQIFSRTSGERSNPSETGTWRLHATATATASRIGAAAAPARVPSPSLPATAEALDVAAYYERLSAQGAHYGPAFRGIVSAARTAHGALGRVELPQGDRVDAQRLLVHPALLDACFQLVGVALPWADGTAGASEDDLCVPVGMAEYHVHRPGAAAGWCEVRTEPAGADTDVFRADLRLLDDDGETLAEVRALELRRVTRSALRRALAPATRSDWAFEVDWPVQPLPPAPAQRSTARWLILADAQGVGEALGQRLRAQGDAVVLVRPGATLETDAPVPHLEPNDASQWAGLIARARTSDRLPLAGVVSLWSLDDCLPDGAGIDALTAAHERSLMRTLGMAKALSESDARLWFVTRGSQAVAGTSPDLAQAPVWGLAGVVASELPLLHCVRVDLPVQPAAEDASVLFETLMRPDDEDRVAWRGGARHVARLVPASATPSSDEPRRLEITERGTLENLTLASVARVPPGPGEVEIRVHATGLNFRDVLNALGMYPGDPGPLGNECAGIVTAVGKGVYDLHVGDEVLAMVDRSFATWVLAPASLTVRKPPTLSHAEAATVPVTFLTAQYALRDLSRIKKGDRVLIHAVTGGVGMAALQLALQAGAEVFGTAGTPAKRALARALGAHHVADSRSLSFAADLMRASGGQGMDIVLNSLAGDFIPESLRLLRAGGRFVEIGKTGIWDVARVASEFPGIEYHALYLGEVAAARPLFVRGMLAELLADMVSGALRPLPHVDYPIEQAESAFRFMGQGHHTGKIVITQRPAPLPRADASYLVTGGLGGLGLECARWLVDQGARHVVLLGRHAPGEHARAAIGELERAGATVSVAQADVADADALEAVVRRIDPPLRGVLHAAGSVDDATLAQLDAARFAAVMAPKVRGTWNLQVATGRCPLDFFVMFSSGAALLGSPGQGNYAAANAFMDALAHRRRARGAHALSINWGSWSTVGMAAAVGEQHRRRWAALGLVSIDPQDGVRMLQDLLYANRAAQAAALPLDRSRLSTRLGPFYAQLAAPPAQATPVAGAGTAPPEGVDVLAQLAEAAQQDRPSVLRSFLSEQIVKVLALGAAHQVDPQRSLLDLGMDSLMAMELRNRLHGTLKVRIAVTDLLRGPSIDSLACTLLDAIGTPSAPPAADAAPQPVEETWEEGSL